MRILIVDDDEMTCVVLRKWILEMGFRSIDAVDIAESAERAMEIAQNRRVDILMTDIQMVNMNGLQLIEAMKRINGEMCSLIITAYASFDYAQKAIGLGVRGFLLKPLEREEIERTVTETLRQMGCDSMAPLSSSEDIVQWAKDYVRQHIGDEVSMAQVANELNLSYNYFSRLFSHEAGITFSAYVSQAKMEEAGRLLKNGMKTTEVADRLGYRSSQNFNRAFFKYWRCTPMEFKRR